jgi:imidazolonepropionase-like amidohydrolase
MIQGFRRRMRHNQQMRPFNVIQGCILLLSAAASPLGAQTSAITNATVITMDGDRILRDATIVIRDGRIAELGPSARLRVPAGVARVDGRGRFVIPGLHDMHAHLHADDTQPDSVGRYELGMMLALGVTSVRMMIGTPIHHTLRAELRRGEIVGPQLWIASPELTGARNPHGIRVTTSDEARAAVRQVADSSYDFVKVTTDITPGVYDAIVAEASARRLRVVGHVDPRVGTYRALEAGQQIEHLDNFMETILADSAPSRASVSDVGAYQTARWETLDHVDERKLRALAGAVARSGAPVTPTLTFFHVWMAERPDEAAVRARPDWAYLPAASRDPWLRGIAAMRRNPPTEARRAQYIAIRNRMVKAIADSGGRIMAGSDGPGGLMAYGFMLHRELQRLHAAGLTPRQALAAATTVPAEFLGAGDSQGRIRVGMRADLVVLDADPLVNIANTERITHVVSGGRWFDAAARAALLEAARVRLNPPVDSAQGDRSR